MSRELGADELRMRANLRKLGVGPDAGLPAVPSRLPDEFEPARERDWLDDILDNNAATAPPAPAPEQRAAKGTRPEPEAAPPATREPGSWSRRWDAITARISPWKAFLALGAAVVPIPWTGYSAAVTWAYTVGQARDMHQGFGYALAFITFALAVRRVAHTRSLIALWASGVTFIGLFGAMSWDDPIHWLTGVAR